MERDAHVAAGAATEVPTGERLPERSPQEKTEQLRLTYDICEA